VASAKRLIRVKTEVDIVEHVLEGVQTEIVSASRPIAALTPPLWFGALVVSAAGVQVLVLNSGDQDVR
jgi:hypothetical protein